MYLAVDMGDTYPYTCLLDQILVFNLHISPFYENRCFVSLLTLPDRDIMGYTLSGQISAFTWSFWRVVLFFNYNLK